MGALCIDRQGSLAVLRLGKARGNAIDPPLLEELLVELKTLQEEEAVRGVLFASSHPRLFCPGLDLVALSSLHRADLERFMSRFAEVLWALCSFPKPLLAALQGHAIAGGCLFALTADWRVLAAGASIGLNEVKLGLPLPYSAALLVRATLHPAATSTVVLLGRNLEGDEAVASGLVHEVHPREGFEAMCLKRLGEFAEKDPRAFREMKRLLRGRIVEEMKAGEGSFLGTFLDSWFSSSTQEKIRAVLDTLGRPRPSAEDPTAPTRGEPGR